MQKVERRKLSPTHQRRMSYGRRRTEDSEHEVSAAGGDVSKALNDEGATWDDCKMFPCTHRFVSEAPPSRQNGDLCISCAVTLWAQGDVVHAPHLLGYDLTEFLRWTRPSFRPLRAIGRPENLVCRFRVATREFHPIPNKS